MARSEWDTLIPNTGGGIHAHFHHGLKVEPVRRRPGPGLRKGAEHHASLH